MRMRMRRRPTRPRRQREMREREAEEWSEAMLDDMADQITTAGQISSTEIKHAHGSAPVRRNAAKR